MSSNTAHVSKNVAEGACYRLEGALMGWDWIGLPRSPRRGSNGAPHQCPRVDHTTNEGVGRILGCHHVQVSFEFVL